MLTLSVGTLAMHSSFDWIEMSDLFRSLGS